MRIGIVNDTKLACEALRRVVLSSPDHRVAWTAGDGAEAIAMAREDRPDLILMDLLMPGIDGVEATRQIMGESPCAILVVTATIAGHVSKVYQAMGYGALDAVETPTLGLRGELTGAVVVLHKIELIGRLLGKTEKRRPDGECTSPVRPLESLGRGWGAMPGSGGDGEGKPLVVLGASTGGPQALAELLAQLPSRLAAGVVIVQHVDATFAPGLSRWLSEQAGRPVMLAAEGQAVTAGAIVLSGTDDHLVLGEDQRLHYAAEPRSACYRPSVDVFFTSVARNWHGTGVAALLTGMLHDGAQGLLALRRRGWRTIAQDEASSVVWGMPRAAIELGAAEEILPLPRIAGAIARLVSRLSPGSR